MKNLFSVSPNSNKKNALARAELKEIESDDLYTVALSQHIDSHYQHINAYFPTLASFIAFTGQKERFDSLGEEQKNLLSECFQSHQESLERKEAAHTSLSTKHKQKRLESLSEIDISDITEKGSTTFITSTMGTGKTQLVGVPLSEWCKQNGVGFFTFVHVRTLVAELARRVNVPHYADIIAANERGIATVGDSLMTAPEINELATNNGLACCAPSLINDHILNIKPNKGEYILFLDEWSQVLDFTLTFKDLDKKRIKIITAIINLIQNARAVICCDADMTDKAVKFVSDLREYKTRFYTASRNYSEKKFNFELVHGKSDVLTNIAASMIDDVEQGKRVALFSDCQKQLEAIHELLPCNLNILRVDSTTTKKKEVKAFMANADEQSLSRSVLLISPSIRSGVSIENDAYSKVYAYFTGVIDHKSACQMLGRFRKVNDFYVCVNTHNRESKSGLKFEDYLEAETQENPNTEHGAKLFDGNKTPVPETITAIYQASATTKTSESKRRFAQFLIQRLKKLGYTVSVKRYGASGGKCSVAEFTKEQKKKAYDLMMASEPISADDYKKLKKETTIEAKAACARFELENKYSIELSHELIDLHTKLGGKRAITRLEMLLNRRSPENLSKHESSLSLCSKSYPVTANKHAQAFFESLAGSSIKAFSDFREITFCNSDENTATACQYIDTNARMMAVTGLVSTKRLTGKIEEKGRSKAIKDALARFGFSTTKAGRNRIDGKDETIYKLTTASIELVENIVNKRHAIPKGWNNAPKFIEDLAPLPIKEDPRLKVSPVQCGDGINSLRKAIEWRRAN